MQMNFAAAWLFSVGIRPGVLKLDGVEIYSEVKGVRGYVSIGDLQKSLHIGCERNCEV